MVILGMMEFQVDWVIKEGEVSPGKRVIVETMAKRDRLDRTGPMDRTGIRVIQGLLENLAS